MRTVGWLFISFFSAMLVFIICCIVRIRRLNAAYMTQMLQRIGNEEEASKR